MKKITVIFSLLILLVSISVYAGSGFYYVHCIDENKRIGNYDSDLTVINNRASHHSRKTGHNTKVYEKQ